MLLPLEYCFSKVLFKPSGFHFVVQEMADHHRRSLLLAYGEDGLQMKKAQSMGVKEEEGSVGGDSEVRKQLSNLSKPKKKVRAPKEARASRGHRESGEVATRG